jgi:adenylate cyclase
MQRRLAAILLIDMVGYSRLIGLDEEGAIARRKAHRDEIIAPTISMHGGRVVKATGDVGAEGAAVTLIAMAVSLKQAIESALAL